MCWKATSSWNLPPVCWFLWSLSGQNSWFGFIKTSINRISCSCYCYKNWSEDWSVEKLWLWKWEKLFIGDIPTKAIGNCRLYWWIVQRRGYSWSGTSYAASSRLEFCANHSYSLALPVPTTHGFRRNTDDSKSNL